MSKKKVSSETKSVVPEPFNSLLPGPTHQTTNKYSDGSKSTGYGNSKTSSENAADKKGTSSSGGCFLTSACVEYMGLNDECTELNTLRKFRDEYVLKLENGREIIAQYYEESPKIVYFINNSSEKKEFYEKIYDYINKSMACIAEEKYDHAFDVYQDMFLSLKKRLLD